jgi:hypothetical protein
MVIDLFSQDSSNIRIFFPMFRCLVEIVGAVFINSTGLLIWSCFKSSV